MSNLKISEFGERLKNQINTSALFPFIQDGGGFLDNFTIRLDELKEYIQDNLPSLISSNTSRIATAENDILQNTEWIKEEERTFRFEMNIDTSLAMVFQRQGIFQLTYEISNALNDSTLTWQVAVEPASNTVITWTDVNTLTDVNSWIISNVPAGGSFMMRPIVEFNSNANDQNKQAWITVVYLRPLI